MKHILLISIVLAAFRASAQPVTPSSAPEVAAPDLAERRAEMLAWLDDYTAAGQFPQDLSGRPLSVFRDSRGVRCPMAELIYRSGHADLVDQVASTHNDLRLADVHDGPLYAWMLDSGLTQEEITMIQGAMTVAEERMFEKQQLAVQLANQWGQVKGHLETAQVALKNATPASLALAQTRRALRTKPASKQTQETKR